MKPRQTIWLFAAASLVPALCILAGALLGGPWPLAALLSITLLVLAMDRFGADFEGHVSLTRWLPSAVAIAHFGTLGFTLWAIGQNDALDWGQKIALGIAMGLYAGQVSNSCAHELIHRQNRAARWLGTAVYCSILNGQHVSAHLLVHHVHAGTAKDPCSAPIGRGYYRFLASAVRDEFLAGWQAETARRRQFLRGPHPYTVYLTAAALSLIAAWLIAGVIGVAALILISAHAQMQLLLSDYVQHYGLRRAVRADGKAMPMGPQHSWNAPQAYSAAMMMNAPRHSDHHLHPSRTFPHLEMKPEEMPTLPYSLPVMGAIALVPPLWRTVMDPRVRLWSAAGNPVPQSNPPSLSTSVMSE